MTVELSQEQLARLCQIAADNFYLNLCRNTQLALDRAIVVDQYFYPKFGKDLGLLQDINQAAVSPFLVLKKIALHILHLEDTELKRQQRMKANYWPLLKGWREGDEIFARRCCVAADPLFLPSFIFYRFEREPGLVKFLNSKKVIEKFKSGDWELSYFLEANPNNPFERWDKFFMAYYQAFEGEEEQGFFRLILEDKISLKEVQWLLRLPNNIWNTLALPEVNKRFTSRCGADRCLTVQDIASSINNLDIKAMFTEEKLLERLSLPKGDSRLGFTMDEFLRLGRRSNSQPYRLFISPNKSYVWIRNNLLDNPQLTLEQKRLFLDVLISLDNEKFFTKKFLGKLRADVVQGNISVGSGGLKALGTESIVRALTEPLGGQRCLTWQEILGMRLEIVEFLNYGWPEREGVLATDKYGIDLIRENIFSIDFILGLPEVHLRRLCNKFILVDLIQNRRLRVDQFLELTEAAFKALQLSIVRQQLINPSPGLEPLNIFHILDITETAYQALTVPAILEALGWQTPNSHPDIRLTISQVLSITPAGLAAFQGTLFDHLSNSPDHLLRLTPIQMLTLTEVAYGILRNDMFLQQVVLPGYFSVRQVLNLTLAQARQFKRNFPNLAHIEKIDTVERILALSCASPLPNAPDVPDISYPTKPLDPAIAQSLTADQRAQLNKATYEALHCERILERLRLDAIHPQAISLEVLLSSLTWGGYLLLSDQEIANSPDAQAVISLFPPNQLLRCTETFYQTLKRPLLLNRLRESTDREDIFLHRLFNLSPWAYEALQDPFIIEQLEKDQPKVTVTEVCRISESAWLILSDLPLRKALLNYDSTCLPQILQVKKQVALAIIEHFPKIDRLLRVENGVAPSWTVKEILCLDHEGISLVFSDPRLMDRLFLEDGNPLKIRKNDIQSLATVLQLRANPHLSITEAVHQFNKVIGHSRAHKAHAFFRLARGLSTSQRAEIMPFFAKEPPKNEPDRCLPPDTPFGATVISLRRKLPLPLFKDEPLDKESPEGICLVSLENFLKAFMALTIRRELMRLCDTDLSPARISQLPAELWLFIFSFILNHDPREIFCEKDIGRIVLRAQERIKLVMPPDKFSALLEKQEEKLPNQRRSPS